MPQPSERRDHPTAAHVIVPWAVGLSDDCQQALTRLDDPLRLPHLHRLLPLLGHPTWLKGDEYDPVPPHERLLAQALGWADQPAPWGALQAAADGLQPGDGQAWGLLTPCHWLMGHDHLTLLHPDELNLSADESRQLFDAVRPLFEDEGWALHWGHPTRWYAVHPSLAALPTASLDRLLGRNPDLWMPEHPQARLIKRLQAEVQMLLYQHPINDAREARGGLTVNSFWLSGCGVVPPDPARLKPPTTGLQVFDTPRQALLKGDVPAWEAAWQALDQGPLLDLLQAAERGQAIALTLCGERHAVTLRQAEAGGWLQRGWGQVRRVFAQPKTQPSALLQQL